MKFIVSTLLALSVLASIASVPASADDDFRSILEKHQRFSY